MKEFCVTGGTGFIGTYLVKALLDRGYYVRATVRDPDNMEKVGYLWELNGAKERLKLVKAELMDDGTFDKAFDGVEGIFHAASPVLVPYDENVKANLIDPCIKGAINILRSSARASSVKRVVFTSSCSAIRYREDAHQASPLDESSWTDLDYCKRNNLWYPFAKTLAEKEAWRVAKEKGIDLVVVNPSFVVGPLISPQPTSTLLLVLAMLKGVNNGVYPNTRVGFVHIDDAIASHIIAMENKNASGRIICSSSVAHWSEIMKMLRADYPNYPIANKCGEQVGDDTPHSMDTSKIQKLGLTSFKSIPDMFHDCIKSFQERGLL